MVDGIAHSFADRKRHVKVLIGSEGDAIEQAGNLGPRRRKVAGIHTEGPAPQGLHARVELWDVTLRAHDGNGYVVDHPCQRERAQNRAADVGKRQQSPC